MDELRTVHLDSAALRCLAHPLRSRLLMLLRLHGPATASGLAARVDTNTGATSYHLRRLADAGLIEEDTSLGTARERFWRAAHDVTSWTETDFDDDPDDRAAADWLRGHYLRTTTRWREDWARTRGDWPAPWRAAGEASDLSLPLTAEDTRRLHRDLLDVVERYRVAGPSDGDVQRVVVLIDTFPQPEDLV